MLAAHDDRCGHRLTGGEHAGRVGGLVGNDERKVECIGLDSATYGGGTKSLGGRDAAVDVEYVYLCVHQEVTFFSMSRITAYWVQCRNHMQLWQSEVILSGIHG